MVESTGTKFIKVVGGLICAGYILWHTHKDGYLKGATATAKIFIENDLKKKELAEAEEKELSE